MNQLWKDKNSISSLFACEINVYFRLVLYWNFIEVIIIALNYSCTTNDKHSKHLL